MTWLVAFVVTVLLEASVYQLPLVDSTPTQSKHRRLVDCLLVNACTHPLVFLLLPLMIPTDATTYVLVAESIAITGEAFLLQHFGYSRPWRLSLSANLVSWLLGSWLLYGLGALGFLATRSLT